MHPRGIIPPLVTPLLADEALDLPRLRSLVDHMVAVGVNAVFVLGTTGEFYAFDAAEKQAVIEAAVEQTAGRVPVLAGTGAETTREVLALNRVAERAGADAVSVITPYYIHPSQRELLEHFRRVAEATPLPVVLYTHPVMCGGVRLEVDTVARLADLPNVVGLKDSFGDLTTLIEYVRAVPAGFSILQGRDTLIEPALQHGAAGAIPGIANVAPALLVELWRAFERGDAAAARDAQRRVSPLRLALALGTAPGAIKAAMNLLGMAVGPSRGPILPLTDDQSRKLADVLQSVLGATGADAPRPNP